MRNTSYVAGLPTQVKDEQKGKRSENYGRFHLLEERRMRIEGNEAQNSAIFLGFARRSSRKEERNIREQTNSSRPNVFEGEEGKTQKKNMLKLSDF